ncbi:MAG TPA: amidohydrolase [Jiangellaceae bacterium]|nr:amidohydrolase [Jiangellaceae bacterium]
MSQLPELIAVRRQLHAHPELAFEEHQTTALLMRRLRAAGLEPRRLPQGTGLVVDIGSGPRTVGVRADIDALPLHDATSTPYRSTLDGVSHACGHDAHTAIALGVALTLARRRELPGRVRVIFQPAEERIPGGALNVIAAGEVDDVDLMLALHCDPSLPVGEVGLRNGPLTAACDAVDITVSGPGGHTSRPHLTVDLVGAVGRVITEVPALLHRRLDPRAGLSLVWGSVHTGNALNAIPTEAHLAGTVRSLDRPGWAGVEPLVRDLVEEVARSSGAAVEIDYRQGVPPVVNDVTLVDALRDAVIRTKGRARVADTEQSLGGEDFGWYGEHIPVAMARLGVHGGGPRVDLHQPSFDIDEAAIEVGVDTLVAATLALLEPTPGFG